MNLFRFTQLSKLIFAAACLTILLECSQVVRAAEPRGPFEKIGARYQLHQVEVEGRTWHAFSIIAASKRARCFEGVGIVIFETDHHKVVEVAIAENQVRITLKEKDHDFTAGSVLFVDPAGKFHALDARWPLPCDEKQAGKAVEDHIRRIIKKHHRQLEKLSSLPANNR